MTRKGWKAFKQNKIPLLSKKQSITHLRFTAEDWDNFLFPDECPKDIFKYLLSTTSNESLRTN